MANHHTAHGVVAALGGPTAVADLLGLTPNCITNAVARRRLPANTYVALTAVIERQGDAARPAVWGMKPLKRTGK